MKTIYKRGIDFDYAWVNNNCEYVIYGLSLDIKKGDKIYCDMCIFKDEHTYIYGEVIKRYKHRVILKYDYCSDKVGE